MTCYFQGCTDKGVTREHIPPRSFFPEGEKAQLLTVKSCMRHNNAKSKDDLYVLAHICLNASPNNRAREVFQTTVKPQLRHNNSAFGRLLTRGAVPLGGGAVRYPVDIARFDDFFTALSCGIVFKSCGSALPEEYEISHVYHNFQGEESPEERQFMLQLARHYADKPLAVLEFGDPDTQNQKIYDVTVFGIPNFLSSITIAHTFFGVFKVTSMLSRFAR